VSGQATRLWKHYFDKINAIIFVVDSTDKDRMAKVRQQLNKVAVDQELGNAPILVFANK
jgi:GTPase SAR1 family protein